MKKTVVVLIIIILVASLLTGCGRRRAEEATPPPAAPAATIAAPAAPTSNLTALDGPVLFEDDFQDGKPDGWKINSGWNVNQSGDVYTFGIAGAGSAFVTKGSGWRDTILRSSVRVDAGSLALSFRLTSSGRYLLNLRQDGTYLVREAPMGSATTLTQGNPLSPGAWHWIAIACEAGQIQVYIDRALALAATDPSPILQGTISFGTPDGSQAAVDNVIVTQLAGHLPAVQASAPAAAPSGGAAAPPAAGPAPAGLPPAGGEAPPPPPPDNHPAGAPSVHFTVESAASASIDAGQCVTTEWIVENALEVYYQGGAVPMHDIRDECPTQSTTYLLEVIGRDGSTSEHVVTVTVSGSAPDQPPGGGQAPPATGADISLADVSVSPRVNRGEPVLVNVSVYNAGSAAAGAFNVRWYPDRSNGIIACSWDINGLAAGRTTVQSCTYPGYPAGGTFEWHMSADADDEINETNEGNNDLAREIVVEGGGGGGGEAPPAPANCAVAQAAANSITLRWTYFDNAGQQGFRVYQALGSLETTAGAGATSATVGNLAPNTQYHLDVRAFNAAGESAPDACFVDAMTGQ